MRIRQIRVTIFSGYDWIMSGINISQLLVIDVLPSLLEGWKAGGHMCGKIMSGSAVLLLSTDEQRRAWDGRSPAQRYSLGLWEQVQLLQTTLCKAAGMAHISTLKSHSSILPNSIRLNGSRKIAWVMPERGFFFLSRTRFS